MYSENKYTAVRRTNDEFLRRMIGGELSGSPMPRQDMEPSEKPSSCHPCQEQHHKPPCNSGDPVPNGCVPTPPCCPTQVHAPSLAMVYAPKQCWQSILDPVTALSEGSLFAELILPLGSSCQNVKKEVCNRRCNLR